MVTIGRYRPTASGCRTALLGAVLAHPLLLALVFVGGAVVGSAAPASGPSPTKYGFDGGKIAVIYLVLVYIMTAGIAAVVVSAVGAALAVGVGYFCNRKPQKPTPPA